MSLTEYFEQHEEQAFVAKALATAVAIILVKHYLAGLISFLLIIFPFVFLLVIRMHAAAAGVDPGELLREHITFFPMMRTEGERRAEVKPWVTYSVIFANVLIFYGFEINVPPELIGDNLVFLPRDPNLFNIPLSAFTSMFLHASGGHLWGNMTFLWVVGSAVERRVGGKRFFALYLLTGLIGSLVFVLVEFLFHGRMGHGLGASGAIAGIMGIFAVRCYFKSMIFPLPILGIFSLILPISLKIRLNSLVIMALFFLADLSGGIGQITGESASMVGHWTHLGGMISGMLLAGHLRLGEEAVEERHLEIGVKASEAEIGYGEGKRSVRLVLERSPDNVEAVLAMARLESKGRCTPEGKELYEKALGLLAARPTEMVEVFREFYPKYLAVPTEHQVIVRLAEALHAAGETELCITCLERTVEMGNIPPAAREKSLFQLATLLEYTSRFEAARSCFARFVAEYPSSLLAEKARQRAGGEVYATRRAVAAATNTATAARCPACGGDMVTRPATAGANRGKLFRVCAAYPNCKGYLPLEEETEASEFRAPLPPPLPRRYRLLFDGTIALTADPQETKANLGRLLRCGMDRVERLFEGVPVVLRSDLEHGAALRMKEAFDRTGAICSIEAMPATLAAPPPAPEPRSVPPPVAASEAQTEEPDFACPKCGQLQVKGEACNRCGILFAKLAERAEREYHPIRTPLTDKPARGAMAEHHERRWAMACHIMVLSGFIIPLGNILGPLAIWLWKRKESEFVDFHGRTALNYQLTLLVFLVGCGVVAAFTGFNGSLLRPLVGIIGLYTLAMVAGGAVKSHRGDYLQIALSAEFIK